MADEKKKAYEHDVEMTGFGHGEKAPRSEAARGTARNVVDGERNEIRPVAERNREKTEHGPETHQDTKTVRANPKMHDREP